MVVALAPNTHTVVPCPLFEFCGRDLSNDMAIPYLNVDRRKYDDRDWGGGQSANGCTFAIVGARIESAGRSHCVGESGRQIYFAGG